MASPTSPSTTAAADLQLSPNHPFRTHLDRAARAEQADPHRDWTPADGSYPR